MSKQHFSLPKPTLIVISLVIGGLVVLLLMAMIVSRRTSPGAGKVIDRLTGGEVSLSLQPRQQTLAPGQSGQIEVQLQSPAGVGVNTFGMYIEFDPEVISIKGQDLAWQGPFASWTPVFQEVYRTGESAVVRVQAYSTQPHSQGGQTAVLKIPFTAQSPGEVTLQFGTDLKAPANARPDTSLTAYGQTGTILRRTTGAKIVVR